jgi:hypothetical protein
MDEVFCYAGDILGYKNILLSLPPNEQWVRVNEFKEFVHEATGKYGFQDSYLIASDTVFVTAVNSKDGLDRLLKFSSHLLENGIKKALPIRAAIDFGPAEIDSKNGSVYGKAAAQAYSLAEEQDWIGTCCAENSDDDSEKLQEKKPKLPYIDELWDFNRIFCYPVPMKNGKVLLRPTVSWNVPSYKDFRVNTVEKGLVSERDMDWKYANRVQNTIIFSQYLHASRYGRINAKPNLFSGDLPIQYLDNIINDHVHETHLIQSGHASIVKMHGRNTLVYLTDDINRLIWELTQIRDSESSANPRTSDSNPIS